MKKAAIITYHASHNIGSMLQTYAMQNLLKSRYNLEVDIIDFSSKTQQDMYSMFPKITSFKGAVRVIINAITYPILKSRFDDYEKFKKDHFTLTNKFYDNESELEELANSYDYFIAGSDQIWNVNCGDYSEAYFLPFKTKGKKISYAPSLGGKNILTSKVDLSKYSGFINDFDFLSVREVNGKAWLDQLSKYPFEVVSDPTLLVDKDVWLPIVSDDEYPDDYIFFYGVPFSPKTYDLVNQISKKLNKQVIMLDAKSYIYRGNFARGFKLWKGCSPSDYLGLIKNASLVITTSYHGSIFSTIFRKNFWAITFKETNKDDDRIKTLFNQINLNERLIYIEDYNNYDLLEDIDYTRYDIDVRAFREKSLNFLDSAIID